MTAAARVNPQKLFAPGDWAALVRRSSWRGLWLVAHAWGVVGLCFLLGALWPWMIPLLMPVVAGRRLGLFILMHDASHGLLHPNRALNDFVGRWLCHPDLHTYRAYHLQHHRFTQQAEDPDLPLSAPFPTTKASLWRKAVRDLSGQTFFRQQFGPSVQRLRLARQQGRWGAQMAAEWATQRRYLLVNGAALALFSAGGLGWLWLCLWWLPAVTWFQWIYRVRNIAEHALLQVDERNPWRVARTLQANLLERVLVAPYWVNYHAEHHLFTQVPCWNLPLVHEALCKRGLSSKLVLMPGYLALLQAASKATTEPSPAA